MPYVREFLILHTFKGFMDKTDRNSAEDFCHPPGAVWTAVLPMMVALIFVTDNRVNGAHFSVQCLALQKGVGLRHR